MKLSLAMIARVLVCATVTALVGACSADTSSGDDGTGEDTLFSSSSDALSARQGGQRPRFVRIRTLDVDQGSKLWKLPDYDAQQVLDMVSDLQPNLLERYISGNVPETADVPGTPPMTAAQFIQASERATDDKCPAFVSPRVTLSDIAILGKDGFFAMTKKLLAFPAGPHPMRHISLDIWNKFGDEHGWNRDYIVDVFEQLHHQGWKGIGINLCGMPTDAPLDHLDAWGHADFAEVCVSETTWQPSHRLDVLARSKSLNTRIVHIDFPNPMSSFVVLSPDKQASILTELARNQPVDRYTFLYPILETIVPPKWDANAITTSKNGPWHGQTLFGVMRDLMHQYNTLKSCP